MFGRHDLNGLSEAIVTHAVEPEVKPINSHASTHLVEQFAVVDPDLRQLRSGAETVYLGGNVYAELIKRLGRISKAVPTGESDSDVA